MKHFTLLLFLFACLKVEITFGQYQFIAPTPGSKYHNPDRNIIIREGNLIDPVSLSDENLFEVVGSLSGNHAFKVVLCDDQKTILLQPATPFSEGESITVKIHPGIQKQSGWHLKGVCI
jgi:hypothetical protein